LQEEEREEEGGEREEEGGEREEDGGEREEKKTVDSWNCHLVSISNLRQKNTVMADHE